MKIKLFDSELKIMELLWEEGDLTAKRIAELTKTQIGWSKTTTYTVIKKCVEKGAIEKIEPGYKCHALITRKDEQLQETDVLIDKMYNGRADQLVASLVDGQRLSREEIIQLKKLIEQLE
ncbi:MAG: BlaI/MecI/CopY family transcriptional regulator [Hespellia sp.]|nr:BlaI/MecI/CopY family transcriptional regulator [Hespellia sp.]